MNIRKIIGRLLVFTIILFLGLSLVGFIIDKRFEQFKRRIMDNLEESISPNVQVLRDTAYIDYLDQNRTLFVYLPANYQTSEQHYPVIYMLDGDALFNSMEIDGPEWQIDERLDEVIAQGGPPAIVIGIENSEDRMTEYKPFRSQYRPDEPISGDQHAEWIVTDLKSWVDSTYRTKPETEHTIIGGASLGGVMAYYMLMEYPDVFSKALVFSASFWVNEDVYHLHKQIENLNQLKIYLSVGKKEGSMVRDARKVIKLLEEAGMHSDNLQFDIQAGLDHWNYTWRLAFAEAYPWIIE